MPAEPKIRGSNTKAPTSPWLTSCSKASKVLAQPAGKHKNVRQSRHMGTMAALEIETDEASSYVNEVRHKLYPYFLERDILLRPLGNTIYVLPPYIITDDELDRTYGAIYDMLDEA